MDGWNEEEMSVFPSVREDRSVGIPDLRTPMQEAAVGGRLWLAGIEQRLGDQVLDVAQLGAALLDHCLEMMEFLEGVLHQRLNGFIFPGRGE